MDESETMHTISYFNIDNPGFYDSIDERLSILGGKIEFQRLTQNFKAYAYDFKNTGTCEPKTGTATIFIHRDKNNHELYCASVHLNGFSDNSFYKKVYNSLSELKNHPKQ
ncbi:MAG: hypothetical protein ACP5NW_03370 [Candidatus Woesearchaeota archaeon]